MGFRQRSEFPSTIWSLERVIVRLMTIWWPVATHAHCEEYLANGIGILLKRRGIMSTNIVDPILWKWAHLLLWWTSTLRASFVHSGACASPSSLCRFHLKRNESFYQFDHFANANYQLWTPSNLIIYSVYNCSSEWTLILACLLLSQINAEETKMPVEILHFKDSSLTLE